MTRSLWDTPTEAPEAPPAAVVATEDTPSTDTPLDPDEQILTFLPTPLTATRSPLQQYRPYTTLPPEEQQCAAFLFDALTPKQADFVMNYLRDGDLARACRETGQPKSIQRHATIQPLLTLLKRADQAFFCRRSAIDRRRFLEEVQAVGFFDPGELVDAQNQIRPLNELPRHIRTALKVSVTDSARNGRTMTMAPYDKTAALELWGQTMGYLTEAPPPAKQEPIQVILVKAKPVTPDPEETPADDQPHGDDRSGDSADRVSRKTFTPF